MTTIGDKFGRNMRAIRKAHRLSQEELGFRCGSGRTHISAVENALKDPGLTLIEGIRVALDVPIEVLWLDDIQPVVDHIVSNRPPVGRARRKR